MQFIDGDCRLAPGWIEAARAFLASHKEAAIVCGRRRELHPQASVYNWLCDVEWNTPVGRTYASGGDSLARVEAFEAVGGFRSQLIGGEEPELCVRLRERGWEIWRIDAEMTLHDVAIMRFSRWWRRLVRSGFAFADVWWLHRRSRYGIYLRETGRAVFWGGFLPLVIVLGAFMNLNTLWLALIYPLHICWIALRRGPSARQSWTYGLFMVLGKFAEFNGVLRLLWTRAHLSPIQPIEYRQAG